MNNKFTRNRVRPNDGGTSAPGPRSSARSRGGGDGEVDRFFPPLFRADTHCEDGGGGHCESRPTPAYHPVPPTTTLRVTDEQLISRKTRDQNSGVCSRTPPV